MLTGCCIQRIRGPAGDWQRDHESIESNARRPRAGGLGLFFSYDLSGLIPSPAPWSSSRKIWTGSVPYSSHEIEELDDIDSAFNALTFRNPALKPCGASAATSPTTDSREQRVKQRRMSLLCCPLRRSLNQAIQITLSNFIGFLDV